MSMVDIVSNMSRFLGVDWEILHHPQHLNLRTCDSMLLGVVQNVVYQQ